MKTIDMEKAEISFDKKEKQTLQSFLSASHSETRNYLSKQTSFFKEEVNALYNSASQQLQMILLPVNNFLKDITDIDKEIEYESKKQAGVVCEGNFVPLEQALLSPMEENY
jgi:hypothetical protein